MENMEYKLEEWGILALFEGQGPRAKILGLDCLRWSDTSGSLWLDGVPGQEVAERMRRRGG